MFFNVFVVVQGVKMEGCGTQNGQLKPQVEHLGPQVEHLGAPRGQLGANLGQEAAQEREMR